MSILFDIIKTAKGKPTDKVSIETHKKRVDICKACPNITLTRNCKVCGCFINDKAKYSGESCPIGKW